MAETDIRLLKLVNLVRARDLAGRTFDACIIGSGASGAVAAAVLAARGMSVLILEQGYPVLPGSSLSDHVNPDDWAYVRSGERLIGRGYPWTACALGGGTAFYAGISFRYHRRDFEPTPEFMGASAYDHWGITRTIIDPHYTWIERQLHVAGPSRAVVGDYHFPEYPNVLPSTPMGRELEAASRQLSLHPVATPMAIRAEGPDGDGCQQLTPCTSFACPVGAKADVVSRLLEPAQGDISVAVGTRVARLRVGSGRTVTSAVALDRQTRERVTVSARRFVLAANAIQSAALLLRSGRTGGSTGIGNSSGLVGRYLAMKNSRYVRGYVAAPNDYAPLRHRYSSVSLLDVVYAGSLPDGMGGLICEANPWGRLRHRNEMALQLECLIGDRPQERNRIWLSRDRDDDGIERLVIDYTPHRRDLARLRILASLAADVLHKCGASAVVRIPSGYGRGSAHLHGTLRAGTDPRTSVTDPLGRLHDFDNLWVVDGSTFPFSGNFNPTLTIQANAHRIAQAIG